MTGNDMRFFIFLFVAVFVFYGESVVWDMMHVYVMNIEVCK